MTKPRLKTLACTGFALTAFAANSILCRLALGGRTMDAASFSTVRLAAGAITLLLITTSLRHRTIATTSRKTTRRKWVSAILLFLYAIAFSFAYISLSAGTGALILFGSVQTTMLAAALHSGERPHPLEWSGLLVALAGLVCLVFPGLTAPSPASSLLMIIAGISWGFYTLRGRGVADPLADTTSNFVRALPLAVVVSLITFRQLHLSPGGLGLAVLSGALASGVGYVVWYAALRELTATRAATVQLAVPVLTAAGGILLLSEDMSLRLLLAAIMILGGVGLALLGRRADVAQAREF
ncbi:MAG: DMT family transporter [Pyrinomonadaceae bacterium]